MRNEPERFKKEKLPSETVRPRPSDLIEKSVLEPDWVAKRIRKGSKIFTKEFNKYFKTFVSGAFSFVAALLWRDAIRNTLDEEGVRTFFSGLFPFLGESGLMYITAFVVTIIAVVSIIIINRILKSE